MLTSIEELKIIERYIGTITRQDIRSNIYHACEDCINTNETYLALQNLKKELWEIIKSHEQEL